MKHEIMAMPSDLYVAPYCEIIYISNEGVLCQSGGSGLESPTDGGTYSDWL